MSQGDIDSPEFELPERQARYKFGWVLLWAIFALLIGAGMAEYLGRAPAAADRFARLELEFKSAVERRQIARSFQFLRGDSPSPASLEKSDKEALATLDGPISDLVKLRASDPEASLLYTAMRREQGFEPDSADLKRMSDSGSSEFVAAAQAYGSGKLSQAGARELASRIGARTFSRRMAGIHALERSGDPEARSGLVPTSRMAAMLIVCSGFVAAFLAGLVVQARYIRLLRTGAFVPAGHPAGALDPSEADRFALRAAQLLSVFVVVGVVLGAGLGELVGGPMLNALNGLALVCGALLLARLPVLTTPIPLKRVGLDFSEFGSKARWGLGGLVANLPIVAIATLAGASLFQGLPPAEHPVTTELASDPNWITTVLLLLTAAVAAPIFEEICFRGVLLPALSSAFGSPGWGIAVSSALFAAIHPTGLPAWPALAAVGAMCGFLTYQTGSLVPAIVLHSAHNLATLALVLAIV